MPLDDLVAVIETLQDRILVHKATLREKETRTRVALIDPLLRALGWEISDPALVTPEYSVGGGRAADYALLGANRKPCALVEAKRLGESFYRHRRQMFDYANMSGVPYAGLTDGDRWELYKVSAQERIPLLQVSIANTLAHQCAQKLLLWPPAPVVTPPSNEGWIVLSFYKPGRRPPIAIRFPGGVIRQIPSWPHLAMRTAAWLSSTGRLTRDNVPVASSSTRYIVNFDPVHQRGQQFTEPIPVIGTSFYYEGGISVPPRVVNDAKKLLEHCHVSLAEVYVHERQDPK